MHYLLYVTYFINVTHAHASGWPLFKTYWLKFRFGITGVKRFIFTKTAVTSSIHLTLPVPLAKGAVSSYPAGAAAGSCILLVSVHLVKNFLLSGNTSFSHTSLHPIPTKLGQSDRYLNHYSCTNNDGVRGQDGVTGVKKVIFTKKASSPTEYLASMRDLCICISLTPSTKVMVLKIHPGSFGVTGVKRSFSPKRHQVLQNA